MTTVAAQCPHCGRKGQVPDKAIGRSVKCPGCATQFTVAATGDGTVANGTTSTDESAANSEKPAAWFADANRPAASEPTPTKAPAGTLLTVCSHCGWQGRAPEQYRNKSVKCRQCGKLFTALPAGEEPPATEAPASGPTARLTDFPGAAGGDDIGLAPLAEEKPAEPATDDVEVMEEVPDVKPTSKPAATTPVKAEAPAREPDHAKALFGTLDDAPAPADDGPRRAFKRKAPEPDEEQRRNPLVFTAALSAGALLLLAIGLIVVNAYVNKKRESELASMQPVRTALEPVPRKDPPSPPVRRPSTNRPPVTPRRDPEPPIKEPDPTPKKDPVDPKDDGWLDATVRSFRLGTARVRVTAVWVNDVDLLIRGEKIGVEKDVLLIQLDIENHGDAKDALNYVGWGTEKAKAGEPTAMLTDNTGRVQRRLTLEGMEGQVATKPIEPGKRISDRLLFAAPADKFEYLRLELPGKNVQAQGSARFQIPAVLVVPKPGSKDPDPKPMPKDDKQLLALRKQLTSKLAPDRIRACEKLGAMRAEGAPAVPDLVKLFRAERNENVKVAICEALAFIGPAARESVPMLIDALKEEFWKVRREAATALAIVGVQNAEQAKLAAPLLKKMLTSKDEEVAERAAEALRRIDPDKKFR